MLCKNKTEHRRFSKTLQVLLEFHETFTRKTNANNERRINPQKINMGKLLTQKIKLY